MSDAAEVPAEYKQAGMFMTLAALVHVMEGLLLMLIGLGTCAGSYGICCFCPFMGFIPIIVGILELPAATNARNGVPDPGVKTANLIGLVTAMLSMSMIGVLLEGLVLMNLGNDNVKGFLEDNS
ncbi:MAG: hypothetical protein KC621_11085 [Myxococcales bacterium]|nr:hypothetical protein [Myxococcales bacterium]